MKTPPYSVRVSLACVLAVFTAARLAADVALTWNAAVLRGLSGSEVPLHLQARTLALTDLAMDRAIADARDERLAAAAAACAAQTVLARAAPAVAHDCAGLAARQLALLPANRQADAQRIGARAGAAVLQQRANDGWTAVATPSRLLSDESDPPGASRRPAAETASPWLRLTPFAIKQVAQFAAVAPYSIDHDGRVVPEFAVTRSTLFATIDRTTALPVLRATWAEPALIAWNRIAGLAAREARLDLAAEARLLVRLNLALADAVVAAEHARFVLGLGADVTARLWEELEGQPMLPSDYLVRADDGIASRFVREHLVSLRTPPIPEYPSVAATLAGAAQAVLSDVGRGGFVLPIRCIAVDGTLPAARGFGSFADAAREAAFAASLDGRHSREAAVAGYQLGASIGGYAVKQARAARS